MRLKHFTAPTMAEAMELVRQELGEDAIIVSTQRASGANGGVRITAALEQADADEAVAEILGGARSSQAADAVREALERHGVPQRLRERLVNAAAAAEIDDPTLACAAALEAGFSFAPLPEHGAPRPFMLVGPPGSGKSIAVSKLAARSVMKRRRVGVLTCDNLRAGAVEQLACFTRILKIDLVRAKGAEALKRAADAAVEASDIVFIDSPGLNPFLRPDLDYLSELVAAAEVEPVLVLAAGGDPEEAADIAEAFASVGTTRLLASRLDVTRRLGSVLAAADAAQLVFCEVSASPNVASGLWPVAATTLARLIVPQPEIPSDEETPFTEAATP